MNDAEKRKKVIRGLECCLRNDHKKCPYYSADILDTTCYMRLHTDSLALLKEQEEEIDHLKRPDCEHAEHDSRGCLGYSGCSQDDEPIEACKRCGKYTGAEEEGE